MLWNKEQIMPLPGFQHRTYQRIATHFAEWGIELLFDVDKVSLNKIKKKGMNSLKAASGATTTKHCSGTGVNLRVGRRFFNETRRTQWCMVPSPRKDICCDHKTNFINTSLKF
jgi:hypothetical protein